MSRTVVEKETNKDGSESVSYRKSWEKNGISHSKEVKKVEGGYIITESKYGKPTDEEGADYIDERKEYVSTTNPLKDKGEEGDDKMFGFIDKPKML